MKLIVFIFVAASLLGSCASKKIYNYSTCEFNLKDIDSTYIFIKIVQTNIKSKNIDANSKACKIYLATNNVNNDTFNLIDIKSHLSEKKMLKYSKEGLLMFKPTARCIEFYSYVEIPSLINKKYPSIAGEAFAFTR